MVKDASTLEINGKPAMLFRNASPELPLKTEHSGLPHLSWRVLACAGAEILEDGYASVFGGVTQTHCRSAVDHVAYSILNDHGVHRW